ncbi:MAG: class I SAM-dependent methyltransferase [Bacteroidota bacterium]|jgi:hypothetical protein
MIIKLKNYYLWGGRFLTDPYHIEGKKLNTLEVAKSPMRYDVINFLLASMKRECNYLEIGVRNPADNFNRIEATNKYSVDPGLEFTKNPVDFAMTSDQFFDLLKSGKLLNPNIQFDVIFIDGLHTAEQVDRDITNALEFVKDDGFIVLHDCNPPTEYHAREEHKYEISPAGQQWNGTTWKGFMKWRNNDQIQSCTVDSDWGLGIISKTKKIGNHTNLINEFFEFSIFNNRRKEFLNLVSFEELKNLL